LSTRTTIQTPQDYWDHILVLDYNDCMASADDLRLAFHCAVSLFHMTDWVYITHKSKIDASFRFKDKAGTTRPVSNEKEFANALRDIHADFELIRQIANTAKHLKLTNTSTHPNAQSHAANTAIQSTGYGQGGFGQGPYGGTPRVIVNIPRQSRGL
jgi:hypothetical protein